MTSRAGLSALVFLALAAPALSADLSIHLPAGADIQRQTARYACEGLGTVSVAYVTAGSIALALMEIERQPRVFAEVLAASGARYASGPFVWWIKGTGATLEDQRAPGRAITCTAAP